jgi:hypothetical protein
MLVAQAFLPVSRLCNSPVAQAFLPVVTQTFLSVFLVAQAFLPVVGQTFLSALLTAAQFTSSLMNSAPYSHPSAARPAFTGL